MQESKPSHKGEAAKSKGDIIMARRNSTELDVEPTEVEDTEVEQVEASENGAVTGGQKATRPELPEGLVSPIAFAKLLTERYNLNPALRPQQIYSYIRNPGKDDPFPTQPAEGRAAAINAEDGFAWWDRKEERKAERAKNAAEKKAKKEAKATSESGEQPSMESGEVAVEAE
jgi:hypothetical protein